MNNDVDKMIQPWISVQGSAVFEQFDRTAYRTVERFV